MAQIMATIWLKIGVRLIPLAGCAATTAALAIAQASPENQPGSKARTSAPARPAESKQVRKDRYGDPLPPGAIARLGTVRLRHSSWTTSAVFTHDGKIAIVSDSDGFILHWDVATGRQARRPQKMVAGSHSALAITSDGKTLASYSGQLYLWDVARGKLLSQGDLGENWIPQMLFTPDGKTLAIRTVRNTIYLWDAVGNKKLHELKGGKDFVSHMALSPDGKTLASCHYQDPHIRLWDVATGKEKLHFVADEKGVLALAFSPDGKTLALIGKQPSFGLFDPNSGKRLCTVKDYDGGLNVLSYSADGKTLIATSGHAVHVLDATSGKHLPKFDVPWRSMGGLAISPDGKTVATFGDALPTFDLWDVAGGKRLHSFAGHRSGAAVLAFAADGATLFSSGRYDTYMRYVRNATTGEPRLQQYSDHGLYVWNAATGEPLGQISDIPLPRDHHGLAVSPDGNLLAVSSRGSLRLLDPVSRKLVRSCIGCKDEENLAAVAWSADSKTLIASNPTNDIIHVWDPVTGKQRRAIEIKQEDGFGQIALSPDGSMAAVSSYTNGVVHLWATSSGKELRRLATQEKVFRFPLAFSPDGTILACGGIYGISLWEPATGRLLRRWDATAGRLAFSSDGRTLVSAGILEDGTIRLWEIATGKERASFVGQRPEILALAISRDDRRIASGSSDSTILIWDATGETYSRMALSAAQLQSLWRDLIDSDAGRAYRALWQIALSPKQALPFLAERLRPVAPLDAEQRKQVDRLSADLDSDQFAVRQQAETELEKIGLIIEPTLRKALESKPSLEVRRRIEKVLENLASERLRITRALEAVEHMNTREAQRLLEALANGAPHAWLTEEARAICKRLAEQSGEKRGEKRGRG